MTCQACEYAKTHEHSGLYHASCPDCQMRMFREVLPLHIDNLKRTPGTHDRRAYIETVGRKHGQEAAALLRAEFSAWWETRRVGQ